MTNKPTTKIYMFIAPEIICGRVNDAPKDVTLKVSKTVLTEASRRVLFDAELFGLEIEPHTTFYYPHWLRLKNWFDLEPAGSFFMTGRDCPDEFRDRLERLSYDIQDWYGTLLKRQDHKTQK